MALDILLKKSGVEDKRPLASQLAEGEISLNYNEAGAFLTCRDSTGAIQQVGGVKISSSPPASPAKQTQWLNTDTLTLFVYDGTEWLAVAGAGGGGGGGDITAIVGNEGIDAKEVAGVVTLDLELVGGEDGLEFRSSKLAASIASSSTLGSVKIGTGLDVAADGTVTVLEGSANTLQEVTEAGNTTSESVLIGGTAADPKIELNADGLGEFAGGVKVTGGNISGGSGKERGLEVTCVSSADRLGIQITSNDDTFTSFVGFNSYSPGSVTNITHFDCSQSLSKSYGTVKGFAANFNLINGTTASYGFWSNFNIDTGPANYNFYAAGTAPSFLAGSTYIGGTTARNTFDLWKSTLTEDQLETLEAGTLVAPANVSLPGDGSFARQWYYDQQDEETQAELDAGTLEYPTHLAAATFTDTFALGDNTAINLFSNGSGEFSNNVTVGDGISSTEYGVNLDKRGIIQINRGSDQILIGRKDGAVTSELTAQGNLDLDGTVTSNFGAFGTGIDSRSVVVIGGVPNANVGGATGNASMLKINPKFTIKDSGGITAGVQGISVSPPADFAVDTENYRVMTALGGRGATNSPENSFGVFADASCANTGTVANYGFYSALSTGSASNFNFYAAGAAPSFLAGSTYIGGTTARNTFDLWKSTLTEYQLEALEAGTLVAPANVSLPGDGEFARQLYYDQQDEETQAELDAGTLEYPEHLLAANFVDNFALGDNTNINLLSTGEAHFAGNVGIGTCSPQAELDVNWKFAQINKPSDFWQAPYSYYDVADVGNLCTQGAYQVHLTSNGYRGADSKSVVTLELTVVLVHLKYS